MTANKILAPLVLVLAVILMLKLAGVFEPAPEISEVVAGDVTESSATISWTTDKPAITQVEYGTSASYGSYITLDTTLTTNHKVTMNALQHNTTYHFRVRSSNNHWNEIVPGDMTFTTLAISRIAFVSDRDSNWEIYIMNTDGSNQTRLTRNPYRDLSPAWSPDGKKIAFTSEDHDGNWEICVMNADGSNQTMLAEGTSPSWSPDGTRIAFTSGAVLNHQIYIMNADGSSQIKLTNNLGGDNTYAAWSPDGKKIAFINSKGNRMEGNIYVMDSDGNNQTRLTNNLETDFAPVWSPDGTKIAFISDRARDNQFYFIDKIVSLETNQIYVMDPDGSNQLRLAKHRVDLVGPTWSPDSTKIAFSSDDDKDGNNQIYVMNADGNNKIRLENNSSNDWGTCVVATEIVR